MQNKRNYLLSLAKSWNYYLWVPTHFAWLHHIFFTRTTLESAKLFFFSFFLPVRVVWNAHIYSKHSVNCANWIALSVEAVYCMTELFWKQLLNEVGVKIILILSSRWWHLITATSAIELKPVALHLVPIDVMSILTYSHQIGMITTLFIE